MTKQTVSDVNAALANCFRTVKKTVRATDISKEAFIRGSAIQNIVGDLLLSGLRDVDVEQVMPARWKKFYRPEQQGNKYRFFFPGYAASYDHPLLILNPNGSQDWCDYLVVFLGIGLPIEAKSAQVDKITWNEGYARPKGLYLFNLQSEVLRFRATTFFMGEHAVDEASRAIFLAEKQILNERKILYRTLEQRTNQTISNRLRIADRIDMYFADDNLRLRREEETLAYIHKLPWTREGQQYDYSSEMDDVE